MTNKYIIQTKSHQERLHRLQHKSIPRDCGIDLFALESNLHKLHRVLRVWTFSMKLTFCKNSSLTPDNKVYSFLFSGALTVISLNFKGAKINWILWKTRYGLRERKDSKTTFQISFSYFFMTVLGLCCCAQGFCSCNKQGLSSLRCTGFSLQRILLLWNTGSRAQ